MILKKASTTRFRFEKFSFLKFYFANSSSFEFYDSYKKILNEMKKNVHKSLYPDNAAFTGFLRIGMED